MTPTTLSHYRITNELGRGGMGIVYSAEDTKLNRRVAIKVLPSAALATDDDRARFYREAQAAAQLHHAHIATIFEIDEAVPGDAPHGTLPSPFIAMEFIEGETLDARIKKGPLKLDDAIRIAVEVASALGMAHEKNIVHRDVKTANVMLTTKGSAKVLDFGLAQTSQSTKLTQMGSTLGTVAYMSPEQARGEEVDGRTDLWALGVVLYEMIAGVNPFGGGYEQAVVYSILNVDPEPLTSVRSGIPMELESIVEKCLRKEARHRYQTASGLIADLESAATKIQQGTAGRTAIRSPQQMTSATGKIAGGKTSAPTTRRYSVLAGVATIGMIIGGLVFYLAGGLLSADQAGGGTSSASNGAKEILRASIVLPVDMWLVASSGDGIGIEKSSLDLSRDGSQLVFVVQDGGVESLAIRDMKDGSIRRISGTQGARSPRFSPDASSIAYLSGSDIYQIPAAGGRPRFVVSASEPAGMSWLSDGSIYLADRQGMVLTRMKPDGTREDLTDALCNCGLPTEGPGGIGIVVSGRDRENVQWIREGQQPSTLNIPGFHVRYLSNGFVLYSRTGSLFASRFDPQTGGVVGDEQLVVDDVRTGSITRSAHYEVSDNGTLVYVGGASTGIVELIIRDPDGTEKAVGLPAGVYGPLDVSPDGRRILVVSYDRGGQQILFDTRTNSERVLSKLGQADLALWMPDGRTIVYAARAEDRRIVHALNSDTGQDRVLFQADSPISVEGISPDGRHLGYRERATDGDKLYVRDLEAGTTSLVPTEDGSISWSPDWSRDGRLFSYTRVGASGSTIIVETFPSDGRSWSVSPSGGEEAEWLPERDALVYRNGMNWYEVAYTQDPDVSFSDPVELFSGPYVNVAGMEYRMLSGGRALLQRSVSAPESVERIEVISGFDRLVERAFE